MSPIDAVPTKLVVGFDGGADDRHVAEVAVDVARALGASVEVVRAMDLGAGDAPDDGPSRIVHQAMTARVAERGQVADRDLAELRTSLSARGEQQVEIRAHTIEARPHEALRAAAAAPRSWIVVGARRTRPLLAQTVDHVLRRASRPVLVVPDGCVLKPTGGLLTGIDAGELDAVVLGTAEAVAGRLGRRLGVMHVRGSGDEATMLRVTEHLRSVAPSVSASATLSVMRAEGTIASTLADHARRMDASLLIVGTHGRRGVARWTLGSTAESLAHRSTTPLLVVP